VNTKTIGNTSIVALVILMASTGMASAQVLDPIISLAQSLFSDLSTLVTVVGGIAFIAGVIMMMFGQGNAWKLALVAFLIVVGVNAGDIVSSISGV